ncbi:ATP-dependent helicase HrpB [Rubritalea squalenifaciens DSM 18772]|uniref:ATP-dependent helicase HrpB n=1 Tax=Rubritalea squalenifaciens DSM 18772 TaxID=1123071 RepID=A0A1M6HFC3_9BACT|nr:ATP-dependent helicase HrpB [Rubritalea squalenifaciens]SHJ20911.1 ATP-dependent helicase HrpB [Rubritalea squalenifaciens DSM 18772]
MGDLPVYEVREALLKSLGEEKQARILLRAPTGSGKSTAVPLMLLDSGLVDGMIVVVQPRRIAARMLARRVSSVRGVKLGREIGYVVRHDNKMSEHTRVVYVTDGVLQRWLNEAGNLRGVGAVLFDEFHERRLPSDLCLAHCLDLQEGARPDLKVAVMSATLEVAGLEKYLAPCELIEAGGRTFSVEIAYRAPQVVTKRGGNSREGIWDRAAVAVKEVIKDSDCGHVLVFMPGVYEIRRTVELIERASWSQGWKALPLYSALSPEKQDEAVYGETGKKIIVSTNVAETSLTIDGVRTVIDAGLARVSHYDPLRGVDTLLIQKISRASAEQRAGRAGRTAPGRCIRLWSESEHGRREAFELPEVQRVDLAETILELKAWGERDVMGFRWLDKPKEESVAEAEEMLRELKAIDREGELSEEGKRMAKLGLHPRYAHLLLAADRESCVAEAAFAAASVQGEGIFVRKGGSEFGRNAFVYDEDGSDFESEWRAFDSARRMNFDPRRCNDLGISGRGSREVMMNLEQLRAVCKRAGLNWHEVDFSKNQEAFSRTMLAAFSDRLAIRLNKGTLACRLSGGRKGKLDAESAVKGQEVFLVTEMREVDGKEVVVYLNRCVGVTLDAVKKMFPDDFREVDQAVYDETIRRVVRRSETRFRDLVITSKDGGEPDAEAAAFLLAERVANGELKLKKWGAEAEQWIARLLCLRDWMPELELPGFDEEDRAIAFEQICEGALGYKDIKDREVMPALRGWLSAAQTAALDAYAPVKIKLANGQMTKVRYEVGKPPAISMQVQRLFGVKESPSLAGGAVKVLVNICAPNQRPWQMTQDLAGFWESGFEQMRKDLGGRYPKHKWTLD